MTDDDIIRAILLSGGPYHVDIATNEVTLGGIATQQQLLDLARAIEQRTIERCAEACCEVNNKRQARGMNQGFNAVMECVDAIRALGAK